MTFCSLTFWPTAHPACWVRNCESADCYHYILLVSRVVLRFYQHIIWRRLNSKGAELAQYSPLPSRSIYRAHHRTQCLTRLPLSLSPDPMSGWNTEKGTIGLLKYKNLEKSEKYNQNLALTLSVHPLLFWYLVLICMENLGKNEHWKKGGKHD